MRIIITHNDELVTSRVLDAVAKYYDGYCLPETVEPKKYRYDIEKHQIKPSHKSQANVTLLFC